MKRGGLEGQGASDAPGRKRAGDFFEHPLENDDPPAVVVINEQFKSNLPLDDNAFFVKHIAEAVTTLESPHC